VRSGEKVSGKARKNSKQAAFMQILKIDAFVLEKYAALWT